MKYKNSFFRIEIKDDGTYLSLYPVVSDGKELDIREIIDFLDSKGCVDYSVEAIQKALVILKENPNPFRIKISSVRMQPFNESAVVTISKDRMVAYLRFYPPSTDGKVMTKREILAELEREKIVYGISDRVIDVFLMARQYCLNIPVAKGDKPVMAKDTKIEYLFNTKPLAKPKVLEDGSVDFHELNLFTKVNKGDVLARLTPHDMGKPGKDIYGNIVPQNKPKIQYLKYGRNIDISEDKCILTSAVDGNVTFTNGTVFVADTYNVAADVDASTGDIDYEGNVMIPGTVKTGFTVRAKGDIQVNGVVEGATLIAGGNIVIKRGVQGMGKGELSADGDICAQFFESANVKVKGDVIAGSILHSNIVSGGKVVVSGRKGFIVGGEIYCENYVEVNSIGNKMETQTTIKIGVKPELYNEMKTLVNEVKDINGIADEISSYLNVYKEKLKKGAKLSPENLKQIKTYNAKLEEIAEERNTKNNRLRELKAELDRCKDGNVKVLGNTYRGVSIFISNCCYSVKDKDTHSLYKIVDGEISPTPF
ncbi:MAG: FapA family protein [Wujia sp.]